jgi:hypothetical protein
MSRQSETITLAYLAHCAEHGCEKCRARSRWMRRRAWRSRKSPNRTTRDRKR